MTDPISPLVTLIEAIARNTRSSSAKATDPDIKSAPGAALPTKDRAAPLAVKSFSALLKMRLAGIEKSDKKQLRKIFIEVSLLSEFGEELVIDPGFSALVKQVSEIVSSDHSAILSLDQTLEKYLV